MEDELREVRPLFDKAMSLPPTERSAFLAQAEPRVREAVERLLAAAPGGDAMFGTSRLPLTNLGQQSGGDEVTSLAPGVTSPAIAELAARLQDALGAGYQVERPLGAGGFAVVFLVHDLELKRRLAVKVLSPDIITSKSVLERFRREAEAVARLSHPNIVPLLFIGQKEELLYLVMGCVEGGALADRLRETGRLPIEEAQRILVEVAGALAHAHRHGVVHRDIKPQNVLLDAESGRALVTDFGIARMTGSESLTEAGMVLGTPAYLAPEQVTGEPSDHRVDIYALGVLGYEILTGKPPFRSAGPPEPITGIRPEVPRLLADVIAKCLAAEPADRFQSAEEIVRALGGGDFVRALTPSVPRNRLLGWVVARPRRIVPIGLAVVAVVALLRPVLGRWLGSSNVEPGMDRIAVLYFDDASTDGSLRWLARGLTEDLIDALAAVPGLTVTSRNGVLPYEQQAASPQVVGRELGVGLLVDGSVEPAGRRADSVRLSVRLVDPKSGVQMERETLVRPLSEAFGLRQDLTSEMELLLRRRIGARVRVQQERLAAGSDAAWELIRRARELRDDAKALDSAAAAARLAQADSLLERAEAASEWVEPAIERAALALDRAITLNSSSLESDSILFGGSVTTLLRAGIEHATRALRRDPNDPRALGYRGEILFRLWQFGSIPGRDSLLEAAHADLVQATGLDPKQARAWYALSEVLTTRGYTAESRLAARKALAADVYAANAPSLLTRLLFAALGEGSAREADSLCTVGRRHFPDHPTFLECPLTLLGWLGRGSADVAGAETLVRRLDTVSVLNVTRPQRRFLFAALLARSGFHDSARAVLSTTLRQLPGRRTAGGLTQYEAYVALLLGERDRALRLLGTIVAEDSGSRAWLASHSWFRSLRDDPTFQRLVSATP